MGRAAADLGRAGALAGTLALALHTTGVLGRLFAEAIENAPPGPGSALRVHGVGNVPGVRCTPRCRRCCRN